MAGKVPGVTKSATLHYHPDTGYPRGSRYSSEKFSADDIAGGDLNDGRIITF